MMEELIRQLKEKIGKNLALLEEELRSVRGNRAEVGLVDTLSVEAYGRKMPLKELSTITTPESQQIIIIPWDLNSLSAIEAAVKNSPLGLTPVREADFLRLTIPPLTAERREELVKALKEKEEAAKVTLRNLRHETLKEVKNQKSSKEIGEDEEMRAEKRIQEEIEAGGRRIEGLVEKKIAEIRGG